MEELVEVGGERLLRCAAEGPPIDGERRTTDLIGEAMYHRATMIAVPVGRLGPDFFQLRSGLAGAISQKLVNYRLKLAVIGDIAEYLAASNALRDWVRECNRGGDVWFVSSYEELVARLGASAPPR